MYLHSGGDMQVFQLKQIKVIQSFILATFGKHSANAGIRVHNTTVVLPALQSIQMNFATSLYFIHPI